MTPAQRDLILHALGLRPRNGRMPWEEFRDQFNTDHGPGAWERNDWCVSAAVETVKGNCSE